MTNVDRPFGFTATRHGAGGTPQRLGSYEIENGLAEDIFSGDPVVLTGTGRRIILSSAGNANLIVGIFAGVRFTDARGDVIFEPNWLSGTVGTGLQRGEDNPEALVYDDPRSEFIIQVSGAAGLVEADVGQLANFVAGTGNAFTGRSAYELDQTTLNPSARQLRILGLSRIPENDYGEFAKARVLINNHSYGQLAAAGV
jgi:hypothetical protein